MTVRSFAMMLVGTILFAGLSLLGWGPGDVRGFIENPARLMYLVATALLQVCIVLAVPEIGRKRIGERTVQRQRLTNAAMQVLSIALVVGAPFCDKRGIAVMSSAGNGARVSGLILFSVGMALTAWAEAKLGRQFSIEVTIQKDHRLVTDGLYQYVRHPRYLGIILFSVGIGLVFRSWLAMVLVFLSAVLLLWRIRDEEALLRAEFGREWDAYTGRSWRLVPFVF